MIDKLEDIVNDYELELQKLTPEEIITKENDSFRVSGEVLSPITRLINEKIKISDTFTHYIIEKCNPAHVKILRKFIEEYENSVECLRDCAYYSNGAEMIEMITISINLLFGMDISYYQTLSQLFSESRVDNICNYFYENIDSELTVDGLFYAIKSNGLGGKQ